MNQPGGAIVGAQLVSEGPESTVIWEESRITWVGPDHQAAELGDLEPVDAEGGLLLPGLIDCHVHLVLDSTLEGVERVAQEPIARVAVRAANNAGNLLSAGITSARDCGSRDGVAVDIAAMQAEGLIEGAHILAVGRALTSVGGHGWMIGVEVEGPDQIRRAVGEEASRGAGAIKLFLTGGVLGSGANALRPTMSPSDVEAAVDEAHRQGLAVAAHVHGTEGIDLALEHGVDTIEHGTDLTTAQARRMIDQGVALVPTLAATISVRRHADELDQELRQRVDDVAERMVRSTTRAIEEGVTVLAGTDSGTPFNPPGSLALEIATLAGLGLGPNGAIAAATEQAAGTLGLDDRGVIKAGAVADLVLYDGDPRAELERLDHPRLVVQGGRRGRGAPH